MNYLVTLYVARFARNVECDFSVIFIHCECIDSKYFETSQFFCGQMSYFWHWICGVYWPAYFSYDDKNCAWQCNISARHETRRWQQPFFQTWPSFGNVSNKRLFLGGRKEGAVFALGGTGRLYRKRLIEVLRRSLPLPFTAFTWWRTYNLISTRNRNSHKLNFFFRNILTFWTITLIK